MDRWYEVGSLVGEFATFALFVYWLLFHKEKCPHCAAREEIEKDKNGKIDGTRGKE